MCVGRGAMGEEREREIVVGRETKGMEGDEQG